MTINETLQEIILITQKIIENGMSIEEKWPVKYGTKISWNNQRDISIAIKNLPYNLKYNSLKTNRNFNFKMIDGALIQMMYEYDASGRKLISHRLAFFPSPNIERYDTDPESYEEEYFNRSEFYDLIERNIVVFPIRFDYNVDIDRFIEIEHPYSHATFGEYNYCRIPVSGPLTPSIFINFILRNFYNYAFRTKGIFCEISKTKFNNTITKNESKTMHFNII